MKTLKKIYQAILKSTNKEQNGNLEETNCKKVRQPEVARSQALKSALDRVNDGIVALDKNWYYTYLNEPAAKMLQRENPLDLVGKHIWTEFPEGVGQPFHLAYVKAFDTQEPLVIEQHFQPWDLWFENRIYPSPDGITIYFTEITERKKAEEGLRLSHQRLLLHHKHAPMGVIEWNNGFEFCDWNPAAQTIFGYNREEVLGCHISEKIITQGNAQEYQTTWENLFAKKGGTRSIRENITKDNRKILCEWHNSPLLDDRGEVIGVTSLVHDITSRQKNEDALRHSQKMDAIGKLTSGIAHDFNNMLGVILGFSELSQHHLKEDQTDLVKYNDYIIQAAERAKKLTSNLLDFSRKSPSSTDVVDINLVLNAMKHMLEKTLTPRIKLSYKLDESLWPVSLDRTRLEDSVLNMCINSMHAMPNGGVLTLGTCNKHLSGMDVQNSDIDAGDYVLLTVDDTGTGITQEVREKMFDPFFTTKGTGGTGLGLSQVYGFVQQSYGKIQVYSEVGHGVSIALHFPRHIHGTSASHDNKKSADLIEIPSGDESILVVDDETSLRVLAKEILTNYGYTVYCADSGEQALEILKNKSIDLLLTDIIMPNMDGYQLAAEVRKLYPEVKIQMVSGFSDDRKIKSADDSLHQQRISKPFNSHELLTKLREVLDKIYLVP